MTPTDPTDDRATHTARRYRQRMKYRETPKLPRKKDVSSRGHKWVPVEGESGLKVCPCGTVYQSNSTVGRMGRGGGTTARRYWASMASYELSTFRRGLRYAPPCTRMKP